VDGLVAAKKKPQENSLYGVIIRVENLDLCRAFYRDVLELGPPISDSNFWVEFRLQRDISLVLERVGKGEKLPVGRGRIAWLYQVPDLSQVAARLKEGGCEPISEEQERLGFRVVMFADPEGNPFYLYSEDGTASPEE
jgi:predicted enzyme related to lactoylglutathione lyase